MRLRNDLPGFGLALLAAIVLMTAGCSSDKTTTPAKGTEGSPTDPQFLLVQGQINNYLDSTKEVFSVGLENIYQLPTDTDQVQVIHGPLGPDDTALYAYSDGWHVTYVSRQNAYFNDFFRDSVQFQINSVPAEEPDGLDYLHFIRQWGYTSNLTDQTHTDATGYINIEFAGLDEQTSTINGLNNILAEWKYISEDSIVTAIFDMDVTVTDVEIIKSDLYGWVSGCPHYGQLSMTVAQSYLVDYGSSDDFYVKDWEVLVEIEGGTADVRVSSDGLVWNYSHLICTVPGS
jgi:hypothetical protein